MTEETHTYSMTRHDDGSITLLKDGVIIESTGFDPLRFWQATRPSRLRETSKRTVHMKYKHTPGPWTIDEKSCIQGMGQQLVVIVYGRTEKERLANLDLIASAPDLLVQKEIDLQEIERLKSINGKMETLLKLCYNQMPDRDSLAIQIEKLLS